MYLGNGSRKRQLNLQGLAFPVIMLLFIAGRVSAGSISAVWANDGEDKVTQDELRATSSPASVKNSVWDGTTIKQFGAKNEIVSFNIILEAATAAASNVKGTFSNLAGPTGSVIRSDQTRSATQLFNWTTTEAELFYIRYLQIKGISANTVCIAYNTENSIPAKLRNSPTSYPGLWTDRPNHDKFYPDIAVPLEVVPSFSIAAGNNQSIWADIYIPKTAVAGQYAGTITISEGGVTTHTVPVAFTVRNFTLPDTCNAKTMVVTGSMDVCPMYTGVLWPNPGDPADVVAEQVLNNQRLVAHRHKISLTGDDSRATGDSPGTNYVPFLSGALFSSVNGYSGPGVGVGNNVYSIGTYGSWQTLWGTTDSAIQTHSNAWETWFENNLPGVERFLYLCDESLNYSQTEQWANWMKTNPGIGHKLPSMATIDAIAAVDSVPSLTIPTSVFTGPDQHGGTHTMADYGAAVSTIEGTPGKKFFLYNGQRPGEGTFSTEDDAADLRSLPWVQYKEGVGRWFFWEATYYSDYQNGRGYLDLFHDASTFGQKTTTYNTCYGQEYISNGDGVLFYPGTDAKYPGDSYGIPGPIASLRLKHWRRGIQDVDYLTLAKSINGALVDSIVQATVPNMLWKTPNCAPSGDYWLTTAKAGWSDNPEYWEAQRLALANIIDNGTTKSIKSSQGQATVVKVFQNKRMIISGGKGARFQAAGSHAVYYDICGRRLTNGGMPANGLVIALQK